MAEQPNHDKKLDINTGKIELPKLDVSEYLDKTPKVESADVYEGTYGPYVKVTTEPVDTLNKGSDNEMPIRASALFGLQADADGNIGWGDDTKLDKFLTYHNVSHFQELVGQPIKLTLRTANNGNEYLTLRGAI